jgi:DNA-binding response OmpR family regulator
MGKKVLIIDDNEQDSLIIKRFLSKSGYDDIIMAQSGEDGLKMVEADKPDIVITDTMLPGIDGFEVCRKIRETYGSDSPKIIIMTGAIDAVDAVKAKKAGADDYCVKTSECSDIIEAVSKII